MAILMFHSVAGTTSLWLHFFLSFVRGYKGGTKLNIFVWQHHVMDVIRISYHSFVFIKYSSGGTGHNCIYSRSATDVPKVISTKENKYERKSNHESPFQWVWHLTSVILHRQSIGSFFLQSCYVIHQISFDTNDNRDLLVSLR